MIVFERRIVSIKLNNFTKMVKIVFDDSTEFKVSVDLIVKYKLSNGQIINDELFNQISKEQRIIEVKQYSYNYATYKLRTKYQIINKLKEKKYTDFEIDTAFTFLYEFNLINDRKFAIAYVKDALMMKSISELKLRINLQNFGIDRNTIDEVLKEYYPKEDEFEIAKKSAEKKMRLIQHKPLEKQKNSLYIFLVNSGYSFDIAKRVLNEFYSV